MNLKKLKTTKAFFKFNNNKSQKFLLFLLLAFSIYCSINLGKSWDEGFHILQGKVTLNYLLSFGRIDEYIFYREYYSTIYWTLKYFFTQIFPHSYQIEATHLINLVFSLSAIIGTGKLSRELFNKNIGKIVFIILFFYPTFFGHMAFNGKDNILAFCHVWIFYLVLRYLKNQHILDKKNNYIILLGILSATATGIQLAFIATLVPILLFVFIEIFFLKIFIKKSFIKKTFYLDLIKIIFIFYFFLILFWIDTHPNIFVLPINFLSNFISLLSGMEGWTGAPYTLLNGEYYLSWQTPKLYFLINFIYKSPEYFLASYIVFFFILIRSQSFFKKRFNFFTFKLILLFSIMLIPICINFFVSLVLYDGIRLFLWSIPYFSIIPGLVIYFLIENVSLKIPKMILISLSLLFIYFLYNFFIITPYHYTYLNYFNGKTENRYQKFENDYWASSLKELIKQINFDKSKNLKLALCGVSQENTEFYLNKNGYLNYKFVKKNEADYIIMTNRTVLISGELTENSTNDNVKLINCFDRFKGKNVFQVDRNGLILSVIRKSKT